MAKVGSSQRGQRTQNSRQEVVESLDTVLDKKQAPVAALGEVTAASEFSRQTVSDRLNEAAGIIDTSDSIDLDRDVRAAEVGGSKVYWINEPDNQPMHAAHPVGAATVATTETSKGLFGNILSWSGWENQWIRLMPVWFLIASFSGSGVWLVMTGSPTPAIPNWLAQLFGVGLFTLASFGFVEIVNREKVFAPGIRRKVTELGDWAYARLKVLGSRWHNE